MWRLDELLLMALDEDIGNGDVTTSAILADPIKAQAKIIAKEGLVLAGIDVFFRVFDLLDPETEFQKFYEDGGEIDKNKVICRLSGKTDVLLKGERVALNLLQHLCGIATLTRTLVNQVKDYHVTIIDTRKTTPLWRSLEKYAVKQGGGKNHRMGLFDGVLIKDNHIELCDGVSKAIRRVRANIPKETKIEIEVKNIAEVKEALAEGADIIMLDNMEPSLLKEAVRIIDKRALIEVSGRINLENIVEVAEIGVDLISVGALTHSAKASDISMEIECF